MNKRLTGEEREEITEWLNDNDYKSTTLMSIEKLLTSEQSGWEEVERLKEENEHFRIHREVQQSWDMHMIESQILMGEEIERLQGQLQDADQFIRYTINNLLNAKSHQDFVDFDEIIKQGTLLYQSIQRIQEDKQNGTSV